ncbi:PBPRA1643 family SWIM/SEC-C metal-binding motif protein [Pseudoalteromonas tunicata]|jgi:SWIM/SEC-C metal-binding protein|uniref:Zinc chelation protein SecC n=1 Tax=Pseudoalteromonas tunicata D2 TaxID=87626 RepID=A4C4T3_9GAMM|nr:PBPRA1643 family SWIM/SEC-C metal-binding motif protein [Pseudoalteromonas tunicata]ATC96957.1 hypothetical protein PTUN_b0598 [Pseudoalteromonas tunicata]AXT33082.1 zinc chelation protein SecC [Pseudoalteromonas tunicata]EAR30565.1 hypothetical protein PTD2_03311 [Pseudoalteromonas tunicata D2]
MSKCFYRGRPIVMGKHNLGTYQPKPNVKLGSQNNPLILQVQTQARQHEIEAMLEQHQLFADISINAEEAEDIKALDVALNKPAPQVFAKTPERNDPCSCGSGKKYKKCCA